MARLQYSSLSRRTHRERRLHLARFRFVENRAWRERRIKRLQLHAYRLRIGTRCKIEQLNSMPTSTREDNRCELGGVTRLGQRAAQTFGASESPK